ncbi:Rid family hydrolase [Streptosporangium sp. NPDC051022]|uniref:RidA family protein n=1 Tax=Streptosporangium sp. NPDC051022 TaxID=3155752 RepID=UPI003437353A
MHRRIQPSDVFEPVKGLYSQVIAVAEGPRYEIAGTLPYHPDGGLDEPLATQAQVVMDNLGRSLASAGLERSDVVRVQIYTTRMDEFLRTALDVVFGWFGDARPTSTLVEVSRLANPKVLVEIDASAVGVPRGSAE